MPAVLRAILAPPLIARPAYEKAAPVTGAAYIVLCFLQSAT